MKFSKKDIFIIAALYGFIVCTANVCGVFVPRLLELPAIRSPYMDGWLNFKSDYSFIMKPLELLAYLIPSIWGISYIFLAGKKLEKRLISLPVAYASIGISGWIVYLLQVLLFLPVAMEKGYDINLKMVVGLSVLHDILELIASFALSYFLMDLCHKKYFFPKFYPDAEFIKVKGIKRLSMKFLFVIYYISVAFFPISFTLVAFISVLNRNNITLNVHILFMVGMVSVIGIIITVAFAKSIHRPMIQLKERIEKLQKGDLETKVTILSNDDFGELGAIFNEMANAISERNKKIEEIQFSVIESMAIAIEGKDSNTGGHIKRTSECVKVFVDKLKTVDVFNKIPESFYNSVVIAAPMHDLGKLYVDDRVLKKNGKFTDEEYEEMKKHPSEGAKVVSDILKNHDNAEFKTIAENIAHYHHEKWNGSGYPEKLEGTSIPLEARIMALADVFDALVSKRCYKESFSFDQSFDIIKDSLGSHFDPDLGKIFMSCRVELEKLYSKV